METLDWYFLWLLLGTTITTFGFLVMLRRHAVYEAHTARHDREIGEILAYLEHVERDRQNYAEAYYRLCEKRAMQPDMTLLVEAQGPHVQN